MIIPREYKKHSECNKCVKYNLVKNKCSDLSVKVYGISNNICCPYIEIREKCKRCLYFDKCLIDKRYENKINNCKQYKDKNTNENKIKNGIKHDKDKLDWSFINFEILEQAIKIFTKGANLYERDNWKLLEPMRLVNSATRHLLALQKAIYKKNIELTINKKDFGMSHLAHALVNILMLMEMEQNQTKKWNKMFER